VTALRDEINLINNTALGAYLLWTFTLAYQKEQEINEAPPGVILFLVLPMLFHQPTLEFLDRTQRRSGLAKFSEKFLSTKYQKSHVLLGIHGRTFEMRDLSLHSMKQAMSKRLLTIVPTTGRVVPFDEDRVGKPRGIPEIVRKMGRNSEKLGYWFSQNSLKEISFYLKVFF
jgi:ABC-three component (ABC-3C) system Middle Component 3